LSSAAVQEALQARLDRLEPDTREVISLASVVGRSFGTPLLERLVPPGKLRPALSELQRLDLLVEERRRPAPEYRFRHGLVQEVAYGRLLDAHRRDLHRAVGEALEGIHRESPEEVYGLLARHYSEADDPERAVEYLLKAGDAARAVYADQEAIDLYRRALAFMKRNGDTRARETLLKIALTHHLAFDFERAGVAFEEAFALTPPEPPRLGPTERLELAEHLLDAFVPGHAYIETSWEFCRHLYRGLVAIARDFEIVPDIAESFTVSADGKLYRFRLRSDARWSDGAEVTARDFAFTWRRMREEKVLTANLLDAVESADAVDARTLEVRLHEPRNYFLYLVGQPPFFAWPQPVCEEIGPAWHESVPLVGNGPFALVEHDGTRAVLVASPTWHGARGNIGQVEVEFEMTPGEGEVRWLAERNDAYTFARPVESADTVVHSDPAMGTMYLAFQSARPPVDDPRVRRALAHAIDRRRYAEQSSLPGEPAETGGFAPPTLPGHSHRIAPAYDPELARTLLAEAGYPDGRGLPELILGELEWFRAEPLAKQFAEIGVRASTIRTTLLMYDTVIEREVHGFTWGWAVDFPDPFGMIGTFLERWPAVYRDARIMDLLDRAGSTCDQGERLAAFRELERYWIDEQVALVPLEYQRRTALTRPWVEGFWQNALVTSTFAEAVVRPELRSAARRGGAPRE
jgi:oligopeptide transport system substrate-binding protein